LCALLAWKGGIPLTIPNRALKRTFNRLAAEITSSGQIVQWEILANGAPNA